MPTHPLLLTAALCTAAFAFNTVQAQSFENAGQYIEHINNANNKVSSTYLSYLSAVGHNKSARKVEKRRQEVVATIFNTRLEIQGMPPWKGDRSYRDTVVMYMKLLYNVFNEDYAKIVNMEEIAEQSYDAMEAYLLAQEKAGEKLEAAGDRQQQAQKDFAARNNVNLVNNTSELEQKSKVAGQLMEHYNDIYLIFFKAYKQEAYLMDAVTKKNVTAIEQSKTALKQFSEEGLEKLKKEKGYNNDATLIVACRNALLFYKNEAGDVQHITDFLLKEEAFTKAKKAFDSKPAARRTQQDIDSYNKGVGDMNAAVNAYNNSNNAMNKERAKALNGWDGAVKRYLDTYMPMQRRG